MTSKIRAKLRSLASVENAIFQIGKGELSDNLIEGVSKALDKRELIKISVLKGCESSPEELLGALCNRLKAEPVAAVGNKIILYRRSESEGARHIEL